MIGWAATRCQRQNLVASQELFADWGHRAHLSLGHERARKGEWYYEAFCLPFGHPSRSLRYISYAAAYSIVRATSAMKASS